jgi:hypothetical protein
MNNEKQLFDMYVVADEFGTILTAPFIQNGYVYASDRRILIRIRESAVKEAHKIHSRNPANCSSFFMETRKEKAITLRQLETLLLAVEQIAEIKTVSENIKCEECEGDGYVVWGYEDWEKRGRCPACDGDGYTSETKEVPTGRMIPDPYAAIKLGDKTFRADYIQIIVNTMKLLEVHKITMQYNGNSPLEQAVFNFNADIDVLLMPYNKK